MSNAKIKIVCGFESNPFVVPWAKARMNLWTFPVHDLKVVAIDYCYHAVILPRASARGGSMVQRVEKSPNLSLP